VSAGSGRLRASAQDVPERYMFKIGLTFPAFRIGLL